MRPVLRPDAAVRGWVWCCRTGVRTNRCDTRLQNRKQDSKQNRKQNSKLCHGAAAAQATAWYCGWVAKMRWYAPVMRVLCYKCDCTRVSTYLAVTDRSEVLQKCSSTRTYMCAYLVAHVSLSRRHPQFLRSLDAWPLQTCSRIVIRLISRTLLHDCTLESMSRCVLLHLSP